MAEHLPAFAEELQREPADPLVLQWMSIVEASRKLGIAFALIVAVSLAACNLLCWGGF